MVTDVFKEFEWRGLVHQATDPELSKILRDQNLVVYAGFDPSAPSLTAAHLIQIIRLRWLQMTGHRPIAVAGGGTGLIGDPSGRDTERELLSQEQVAGNVESIRGQLSAILDFEPGDTQALLVNNADWLTKLNLTDFLRDVGKHFSVNSMISKEAVKTRLTEREQGISYTEFSYLLLQAFDFLHLFDAHGCRMQIGGSDQWGNITAGVELIRRVRGETAYGLTSPLIEHEGRKMSKSEGTAVWLAPEMTSPYEFYQYWINTPDSQVSQFLRFFTFLERQRIEELEEQQARDPAKREAQRALAWEVTALVHGDAEAARAKAASEALFGEEIAGLDEPTLLEVMGKAPTSEMPRDRLQKGVALLELLAETGLSPSKSAARTDISSGGAYINNRRETDPDHRVGTDDLLHGKYLILRKGRKTYHLVRAV
ncbi:MAG: tyrosine--tRNA ligase [Actinobacteria bacterium]|nr:tyrosine--tRNA ligase [Actinomycetota bacterium]